MSVSAAAPILNTDDPTIGSTFTANTISNLPAERPRFLGADVVCAGRGDDTTELQAPTSFERSTYNSDTPNFNGNRAQANNYTLDGIDMNETYNNLISYSPAPAAHRRRCRVVTADSPTDYGNVNGAGVVSVLKSGTNQFHGSAYGYVQDYRFDANSYQHRLSTPALPISPYSFAQFGGNVGGPILRNKLFFFGDYLGSRWHVGGLSHCQRNSATPCATATSRFCSPASNPIQLYDPENNFAPYANNENVPIINPVAKFLFAHPSLYPDCGVAIL